MQQQMLARTSYSGSIVDRSPAAMIGTPFTGEEKKYLDYSADNGTLLPGPVSTTGSFILLNTPLVGAAFYNRIGSKITMKSVHVKVNISARNADVVFGGNNQTFRWLLVYDRQTNGAEPTIATLLRDYQSDGANNTVILSGMNPTQTGRFIILREHFVKLVNVNNVVDLDGAADSLTQHQDQWFINWFVKLKDLETIYQASTGLVGDVANGALWLVALGDAPASNQMFCSFTFKSRLRFLG